MRRLSLTAVVAVAMLLTIAPTEASAATTIGETFAPASDCLGLQTRVQSTSPAGQYSAQSDGVITRWSFEAGAAPPDLKFKAARLAGGNDFTVIGESAVESPDPSTLNSFFTRIPVRTGDIIGFYNSTPGKCVTNQASYTYHSLFNVDVPPGDTETFSANPGEKLDVSALLEPDCDKDGLGDETQDSDLTACHSNAFSFAGVKRNKKKGTATLQVNVPEPGELIGSGNGAKVATSGATTSKEVTPGTAQLLIKAKGKKKRKLNETGKVKLSVAVTYTPTGGKPNTQSVEMKLNKEL